MARDFDGSADYLEVATAPVTALPLTLVCWMRTDQNTLAKGVFYIGRTGANGRVQISYEGTNAGDPVSAVSVTTAGTIVSSFSGSTPSVGTWFHAAAVFSSNTSRTAFLNGVAGTPNTTSNDPSASLWDRTIVGARRNSSGVGAQFDGQIAEAAVYNAALTAAEIEQLAAGYSPLLVRPQSLVYYAPLHGRNGAAGDEDDWIGGRTAAQTSSPGLADHPRIIYPRSRIWVPVSAGGGGDVSLALSGAAATTATGNTAAGITTALTGISSTAAAGTLSAGADASVALTGVSSTAAAGSTAASISTALTGISSTAATGTLDFTVAATRALTGVSATAATGTLTAGGDVTISVTGQAASTAQGTVGVTASGSAALAGASSTAATGTLAAGISKALTGASAPVSAGSLVAGGDVSVTIAGQAVATAQGTVGVTATGAVTVALTGAAAVIAAGNIFVTAPVVGWTPVDDSISNAWIPVDDSNAALWA